MAKSVLFHFLLLREHPSQNPSKLLEKNQLEEPLLLEDTRLLKDSSEKDLQKYKVLDTKTNQNVALKLMKIVISHFVRKVKRELSMHHRMQINKISLTVGLIFLFSFNVYPDIQKSVVLIIDSHIAEGISESLEQFSVDLYDSGYNVVMEISTMKNPEEIRTYLIDLYNLLDPPLMGAILIGAIPLAKQRYLVTHTSPNIPDEYNECLSLQFYSDLDGIFSKTDPAHPDCYNIHEGDIYSEIWISHLPKYQDNNQHTIEKLNQYFEKNHKYRTGQINIQEGYLGINEHEYSNTLDEYNNILESLKDGQYSWYPFTYWGNVGLFINNSVGKPDCQYAYANELSSNKYNFSCLTAHGNHKSNGEITTDWVLSHEVKPTFIWLGGCNTGNLIHSDNILTAFIYSEKSDTLTAKGATTFAGGLGTNVNGFYGANIAGEMLNEKCLGEAYLEHNNTPLMWPWSEHFELHYAPTIFLGDLTLRLVHFEAFNTWTLTTQVNPSGSGTITKNPNKVNYNRGEKVQLTANPKAGYRFSGWTGDASGTTNPITITMDSDKSVIANFIHEYKLRLRCNEGGTTNPPPGDYFFNPRKRVRIKAIPNDGYRFKRWRGAVSGSENSIRIIMDSNKRVKAIFVRE